MKEKLIVTAALAGGTTTKHNNPNTPFTAEEFAKETYRCLQEGVSIVHIHAKDPETGMATMDVQAHRDIAAAVEDRCPEMIINISTGGMQFDPLLHMSLVGQLPENATYSVCGEINKNLCLLTGKENAK